MNDYYQDLLLLLENILSYITNNELKEEINELSKLNSGTWLYILKRIEVRSSFGN